MFDKKSLKNVTKKLKRKAIKRYFNKGYNPKVDNIVKDVAFLKSVLNPEKKKFQLRTTVAVPCGQTNGNSSGFIAVDITPQPSQGASSIDRNGNSIRLHSQHMKFHMYGQSATVSPMRFKMLWVKVKGTPYTSMSTLVDELLENNAFILNAGSTAIIDYSSDFDVNQFPKFQILRTKYIKLQGETVTGQREVKTFSVSMKYKNHHVRYVADGGNAIAHGQIVLIILADNGNMSSGTASTLTNAVNTATNTGSSWNYDINSYFYDN